ncbi:unnamed protein product [Protopolystoma xenopodis]|uniref:Uncharacterized protein n=1 Tax=Protopolystoma xenopodis TaxID=117903 RepID=A0A3S5AHI7_9PLAT|nr:unnamed protein product [Protopolystoma xenopodis]
MTPVFSEPISSSDFSNLSTSFPPGSISVLQLLPHLGGGCISISNSPSNASSGCVPAAIYSTITASTATSTTSSAKTFVSSHSACDMLLHSLSLDTTGLASIKKVRRPIASGANKKVIFLIYYIGSTTSFITEIIAGGPAVEQPPTIDSRELGSFSSRSTVSLSAGHSFDESFLLLSPPASIGSQSPRLLRQQPIVSRPQQLYVRRAISPPASSHTGRAFPSSILLKPKVTTTGTSDNLLRGPVHSWLEEMDRGIRTNASEVSAGQLGALAASETVPSFSTVGSTSGGGGGGGRFRLKHGPVGLVVLRNLKGWLREAGGGGSGSTTTFAPTTSVDVLSSTGSLGQSHSMPDGRLASESTRTTKGNRPNGDSTAQQILLSDRLASVLGESTLFDIPRLFETIAMKDANT